MISSGKNKTILFMVTSQEYYRNYITSSALDEIKDRCVFVVDGNLMNRDFPTIDRKKLIPYTYPEHKNIFHKHLFNINMWKFRNLSTSFVFRFTRRLKERQKFIYRILSLPIIYHFIKFIFLLRSSDSVLEKIINKINPSLILIPSSGYEGLSFEVIKIAKDKKISTCLLIDNWDNLSSKTIFTRKPDCLVVWGQQAIEDAVRIHKMDPNKVFALGTPRFIEYEKESKSNLSSPYPFNYILFAGNALPFDELSALKKLDEIIDSKKLDLKVVYRPHPMRHKRKCLDNFVESDFRHIVLDIQARDYYGVGEKKNSDKSGELPDLKYYPRLLSNMEFMICPLSSMIIESLLFNKPVFVLAYDDRVHSTNPKELLRYYEHFRGIENLNNVEMVSEFNDLEKIFNGDPGLNNRKKMGNLNYYISEKTKDYPRNLKLLVEDILK